MFDIAFSELVVIAIVALIVIGPEKLPKVARTIGTMVGRMQRYVAQIKEEVNRESRFAELQKLQQEIQQATESAQANVQNSANYLSDALNPVNLDPINPNPVLEDTAAASNVSNSPDNSPSAKG